MKQASPRAGHPTLGPRAIPSAPPPSEPIEPLPAPAPTLESEPRWLHSCPAAHADAPATSLGSGCSSCLLLGQTRKSLTQGPACTREQRLERVHRHLQNLRSFYVRQPLEV